MSGSKHHTSTESGIRDIDVNRECLSFVLERLFHPQVICFDPGETCSRIEETIRLISRNMEREERLMVETEYPGFAGHKREHEKLLVRLGRLKRTLACSNYDNSLVAEFLTEWAESHAADFDKPFGDFLREHGVTPVQR